jgi:hypothetical protein
MEYNEYKLPDGLLIEGSESFRAATLAALAVLSHTSVYAVVVEHLRKIREAPASGMRAWGDDPAFEVGRSTWEHSPIWYASAIAHDARHAQLYNDAKAQSSGAEPELALWTGVQAERECLAAQLKVLEELSAPDEWVAYVNQLRVQPEYQDVSYTKRDW